MLSAQAIVCTSPLSDTIWRGGWTHLRCMFKNKLRCVVVLISLLCIHRFMLMEPGQTTLYAGSFFFFFNNNHSKEV